MHMRKLYMSLLGLTATGYTLPQAPNNELSIRRLPDVQEIGPRDVTILHVMYPLTETWDPEAERDVYVSQAEIFIEGTPDESAVVIRVDEDGDGPAARPKISMLELGPINQGQYVEAQQMESAQVHLRAQGEVTLSNTQILDSGSGTGIIADIIQENPNFVYKPLDISDINDSCMVIERILRRMNIPLSPKSNEIFGWNERAQMLRTQSDRVKLPFSRYSIIDVAKKTEQFFSASSLQQLGEPQNFRIRFQAPPDRGISEIEPAPFSVGPDEVAAITKIAPSSSTSDILWGRLEGVFASVPARVIGTAVGEAANILSFAFIIIDLVEGQWIGAAVSALAFGLGVAIPLAIGLAEDGPAGLLIGGIVALFAILPTFFIPTHIPPSAQDAQQILQWSFFGDATHTGNEKCREHNATYHGNPNCTAVYGPSIISRALKIDIFDVIAFLIKFNHGMPMSIPDMADSFFLVDPTRRQDGNDQVAIIDCGNRLAPYDNGGGFDDPSADSCPHPKYTVHLPKITIPSINQTADVVLQRIIPAPNGDCRLVTYPGPQHFPEWNATITGLPSGIDCNISSSLNISGLAVNADASGKPSFSGPSINGQNASLASSGNSASNGIGGDSRAPPMQAPFLPIIDSSNAVCVSDSKARQVCLPAGTYSAFPGDLGPATKDINTLSFPPTGGALVQVRYTVGPTAAGIKQDIVSNYTTTFSPPKPLQPSRLQQDMQSLVQHVDQPAAHAGMVITYPSTNKAFDTVNGAFFCLYSQPKATGDVLCLGLGGTMLPEAWQKKAMSVRVPPGIGYELFVQNYADAGGNRFSGNADDLTDIPYGSNGNFAKNVVAAWAYRM